MYYGDVLNKNNMQYIKLKDIDSFTVEQAGGFAFKMWNQEEKRMMISETWQEGFKKAFAIKTDKGLLDLSQSQLGQMLASAYKDGVADILGKTFNVKTNGKTGMEIRYFLNLDYSRQLQPSAQPKEEKKGEEPPLESYESLPF